MESFAYLRQTYELGAGGGFGLPIIGKLLGHTQASTTQRYAHLDADVAQEFPHGQDPEPPCR
jgi:site-specific recombinase XerD